MVKKTGGHDNERNVFYNSRMQPLLRKRLHGKGMKVKLVKEPDNEYDNEAIQVKIKGLGKVGYVANSPYTVKGESMSAGRLYDKIGGKAKGKIVFVTDGGVICKVISDGKDKPVMIEEDKVNDEDQLGFKI